MNFGSKKPKKLLYKVFVPHFRRAERKAKHDEIRRKYGKYYIFVCVYSCTCTCTIYFILIITM